MEDLLVSPVRLADGGRRLDAVQRGVSREWLAEVSTFAARSFDVPSADGQGERRVGAKGIVIVEVFVAAGDGKHALRQQMLELVFDEPLVSLVPEAAREPREEVDMVGDLPQQQQPSVRGDVATVERCDDIAATETLKSERGSITLCPHWPVPLSGSLLCLNQ